jgi:penicillin-binding protein 1B
VHGPVPLVRALGDSLNLATVNLGLSVGVDQVVERLTSLTGTRPDNVYPSLLLGAEPMTPLQVASLYGTFASGGFHMAPKSVVAVLDEQGNPLTRHHFELDQRIDSADAQAMMRALELVMERGTGKSSRFAGLGVAGKTGTSDDYRDSWFTGFDSQRLAVVWIGYDDNRSTGMTGAAGAMKLWDGLFRRLGVAPLSAPSRDWPQIEYSSGLLARESCAEVVRLPLPPGSNVAVKSGCGMSLKALADELGRKFKEWFD